MVTIAGTPHAVPVIEKAVGIQRFVARVLISAAVEVFGPGLRDHLDDRPAVSGVFGLITVQQDLDFADGIQRRDARKHVGAALIVTGHAVDGDVIVIRTGPADARRAGAIRAAGRILIGLIADARNGSQQGDNVAAARREIRELVARDGAGDLRTVGGDLRGMLFHHDRVFLSPDIKADFAHAHPVVRQDVDVRALGAAEALLFHAKRVGGGLYRYKGVSAAAVSPGGVHFFRGVAGQSHIGVRNGGSRGVHHISRERAGCDLTEELRSRQCENQKTHSFVHKSPFQPFSAEWRDHIKGFQRSLNR